jgi:RNA polymerase sigma-70 factor (ECF subfamily)
MQADAAIPWEGEVESVDDEAALVEAAQQDPAAFAPLYRRYRHRVYAYLCARLTNAEDAADLTQQVFVQALAALPRYRPSAVPFGVWLFRIARNAATDHQRRQQRSAVTWEAVPEEAVPRTEYGVEDEVVQREALAHLHAILVRLDPDTRDLLMLRFAARLTAAEIGAVIGKSTAATSKRLQRALQTLKEQYHEPTA